MVRVLRGWEVAGGRVLSVVVVGSGHVAVPRLPEGPGASQQRAGEDEEAIDKQEEKDRSVRVGGLAGWTCVRLMNDGRLQLGGVLGAGRHAAAAAAAAMSILQTVGAVVAAAGCMLDIAAAAAAAGQFRNPGPVVDFAASDTAVALDTGVVVAAAAAHVGIDDVDDSVLTGHCVAVQYAPVRCCCCCPPDRTRRQSDSTLPHQQLSHVRYPHKHCP
eukprot:1614291-Rhodomonas_salina.2